MEERCEKLSKLKKVLDKKPGARFIYMEEEFQRDGLFESGGNAYIEARKTPGTIKDSSRSERDAR